MPELLAGKTALILGVANKWSLAYAIAQAFHREGAKLLLTYQGDRQKETVGEHGRLDALVHSIAFANREDLTRPFLETSREGFTLAQDVSAYSLVSTARTVA